MNEELAKSIYDSNGGNAMFGDYQAYLTALNSNPKYVAHIYNKYGSKNFGSQSEFEGSLKKKEPTQPESGSGSNQTQPSSGSQPSQGKSVMEQAAEIVSGPKKTTLSQVEEVEAGTAAPAEFGLEGIRKIKGPSIEAVSESTAPKMPGYINIAQQEAKKTQKPKDNIFEYKATPQEQAQIKTDKANRVAFAEEQRKAADYNYNNLNKELYDIYEGNDVTGIESQLNKIETDYKNGAFAGKEDEYQALKTDLFNRRANSYNQLENKYLDILREDEPSKYKEYVERRAGILKDLNEAGYASWDDYQLKRDLNDQKTGAKRDLYSNLDDSFDVVDKADQNFLRTLRMEAINQVSAPNVNGEGNYIPGLGTGFKSAQTIEKFHKDTQPIMSDYEALMNENAAFERDYQAGKYTPEDANAKYQELKLKEQQLSTRLNQAKKESGVTDYDLQRYDLSMRKQGALGSTYETGFKDLKATEDAIRTEQENRQRWVAENPVLGTLTYFAPTVWKEFSNMAVLEAGKALKPLGETVGLGDGYGWTDAMYYGIKDVQENREALYGYGGQDINGDGVPDDLPGFAKYGQILAQGLGSVGAFMIPGTYASNLFKGSSLGMRSARFATNWAGGFLMMEGPAYDEALRAGLSNEDAARSATLIATLQSAAEQLVPDIKYLDAPVTRAGIISMAKAKVPWDEIMSNGMKYLQDLSTATGKSSLKEAGEEVVGQFATDVGQTISNDAFVRTTHFNMNDPMHPEYSTKPYDNTWELKNYTDAAIGGALTGGFMTGLKGATRTYTKNEMEALSYMGKNWKDILANIEKTESNGVNRGDERFKEIEKDLKGVSTLYQSLQSMPGYKDLTKANQDMVLSLAFQKKNIQENVRNLGVELPSVKEALAGIDERINAYMTGQLDYGADKPVSYIDDNLAAMGVALVSVNPDGTYSIDPKKIEGVKPEDIVQKAEEYIQKNIKDESFANSFYHPKTDRDALSKQKTSEVPVQPEAGVGEEVAQGKPTAEPQVTTEEGKKEEVANPLKNVESTANALDNLQKKNPVKIDDEGKVSGGIIELQTAAKKADKKENVQTPSKVPFLPNTINLVHLAKNKNDKESILANGFDENQASIDSPIPGVYFSSEDWETMDRFNRSKQDALYTSIENDGLLYFDDTSSFAEYLKQNGLPYEGQTLSNSQIDFLKNNGVKGIILREDFASNSRNELIVIDKSIIKNISDKEVDVTNLPSSFNDSKSISEAYHKAKEDGSNPELVNEVERLLGAKKEEVKPTTTKQAPEAEAPVVEAPVVETPTTEAKPAAGVRAVKPKVFDAARKNTLLAKFKNDSGKRALVSSIDRAATAIRQAYGNVPIYVHETTSDMEAATAITGGATMARTGAGTFQYDADGNVIAVHVNLAKAGIDTAPHEFTHLILMDAFGDNPKLFKEFKDRIVKALSASRVAELEAFANQYTDENVKPEEFLAQLAGVMTANREKLTPTMAQKIMNLINEFISRITKGKLIPFKANAQTKDLMDFFNTVSSAMATGKGGEAIKAAAEKAGSKFETAKKPIEEAGARDRSKEQIKSSDAKAIKPENFAYDNEWDVVANGEKIGRTYYDRSIKSWVNADFYKGSVSASKDTFLWVYGDILGETKQEAINELVRRYNEGATKKDIIEQQTPVIKEATREDVQGIYDDIKQSGMPVYQSPLQQRTFIVNDNVFVEMYPFEGSVHLSSISSMEKGKGNASSVMRQITNSADSRGLKMDLGAKAFSEGGLTTSKLIDFYTKFGFTVDPEGMFAGDSLEEIKEYVDDNPRESVDMIRLPKVKSKEQIVGQAGVETAADDIAMQDLDVAKDMEAANRAAQDIKSATGWEVGADGQWRYEYPDVELNDDIADDFDVLFYLQENAKREGVRVRPNEMYPPAPLNRILDFGKLEQAYPYIDEIAFAVNPNLGGAAAVFRPDRNLIEFGPDAIKNEGVEGFRRTLIHEIQHYVQEQEGFEGGSNLTYEADKFSKSQDVYKIPGLSLNGAANVGEAVKNGTKEILDMMDNGITVTDIIEGNYDKTKYSGNPEAIVKHVANEGDAESLDEMAATDLEGAKKIVENAINKNAIADVAFEQYKATAGEVEARNAEERSKTPYAERLYGKTLESTEDVARRNQILDSAKKAVSAMDVIAKKRGVAKAAEIKAQREILGENYDKAKQISDNFEDIAEKLGITKICGL